MLPSIARKCSCGRTPWLSREPMFSAQSASKKIERRSKSDEMRPARLSGQFGLNRDNQPTLEHARFGGPATRAGGGVRVWGGKGTAGAGRPTTMSGRVQVWSRCFEDDCIEARIGTTRLKVSGEAGESGICADCMIGLAEWFRWGENRPECEGKHGASRGKRTGYDGSDEAPQKKSALGRNCTHRYGFLQII